MTPAYIPDFLRHYTPPWQLRYFVNYKLNWPLEVTRAFQKGALTIWNQLPLTIRSSKYLHYFKKLLKSYMERRYHLNNLFCNLKQLAIFDYVYASYTSLVYVNVY